MLDGVPDMLEGIEQGVKGVCIGLDESYVRDSVDPELADAVLAEVYLLEEQGVNGEICKMLMIAEKRFRRLNVPELMKEVYRGPQYVDGMTIEANVEEVAA